MNTANSTEQKEGNKLLDECPVNKHLALLSYDPYGMKETFAFGEIHTSFIKKRFIWQVETHFSLMLDQN